MVVFVCRRVLSIRSKSRRRTQSRSSAGPRPHRTAPRGREHGPQPVAQVVQARLDLGQPALVAGHRDQQRPRAGAAPRRTARRPSSAAPPPTSASSSRATAIGVGWSKTSVAGSRSPVAWASRLRSSTAVSESKPRSLNARSGSTSAPRGVPEHGRDLRPHQLQHDLLAVRRGDAGQPLGQRPAGRRGPPGRRPDQPAQQRRQQPGPGLRPAARPGRAGSAPAGPRPPRAPGRTAPGRARPAARRCPVRSSRARSASPSSPVIPVASAHRPQASEMRRQPGARRRCGERVEGRRWRRRSCAWPGLPSSAAAEENSTNADRSSPAVSSCRCQAASTFGRSTRSSCSAVSDSTTPSSSTPAACTTAVSGRSGDAEQRRPAGPRSATSQAATCDRAPSAASSATSSSRPGGGRAAAADQQQVPHPVPLDQVPGHQRAEPAGAAGDQHRAVRVQRRRHGQHDLADVAALAQVPERLPAAAHVPGPDRRGREHALLEQRRRARAASAGSAPARPPAGRTPGSGRRGARAATTSGSRMSVLPISTNRPPRGSRPSEASTNSPASESSTTSTPRRRSRPGTLARSPGRGTRRCARRRGRAPAARPTWPGWRWRTPPRRGAGRAAPRPCRRRRRRRAPAPAPPACSPARSTSP